MLSKRVPLSTCHMQRQETARLAPELCILCEMICKRQADVTCNIKFLGTQTQLDFFHCLIISFYTTHTHIHTHHWQLLLKCVRARARACVCARARNEIIREWKKFNCVCVMC